ncbi:hypothetical protein HSBAA_29490 [Vreelandella sulfidaeris]|uniref:Uncharacterized protein n=1 Tax=Vreelandella sulfidaeris TaxID=115553 RepID=A0A455U8T7_9GAMM|nr:hypothetical protein HSBAA_29490 [Halomonas sulfidaeris]
MTRATTSRLIATFNESNGRLNVDRAARTITVTLTSAYTLTLPESKNYYAIELAEIYDLHTGATKEAFRVIEGRFDILPQIIV